MKRREIKNFLYREACLMDEHRYQEWLSLWTDDAIYWVPCRHEAIDPIREVSIIYDDRAKLADRVVYLEANDRGAHGPRRLRCTRGPRSDEELQHRDFAIAVDEQDRLLRHL